MSVHIFIYILSFIGIWIGSGFVIRSVEKLSGSIKVSSFIISFLLLGAFTSVSEFSVGLNSIFGDDPEIFVGNLIGASMVLFMVIIPLLAIFGKSIRVSKELQGFNLPASLVTIAIPAIMVMDGKVGRVDAIISLVLFCFLVITIQSKDKLIEHIEKADEKSKVGLGKNLLRIIFGVLIIFISSRIAVEQTHYFSEALKVSPFLISLVVVSFGTNLPELSLVVRSVFMRNHQIAFGDYVGSAAFNTFIFGILMLFYNQKIVLTNNYVFSLVFLIIALLLFYHFARTKNTISRIEGLVLLLMYIGFLFMEYMLYKGKINWL